MGWCERWCGYIKSWLHWGLDWWSVCWCNTDQGIVSAQNFTALTSTIIIMYDLVCTIQPGIWLIWFYCVCFHICLAGWCNFTSLLALIIYCTGAWRTESQIHSAGQCYYLELVLLLLWKCLVLSKFHKECKWWLTGHDIDLLTKWYCSIEIWCFPLWCGKLSKCCVHIIM